MIISNKFLILLLMFAIAISSFSVLINLGTLNSLKTTGRASEGVISFDIPPKLSITTEDGSFIDFGNCRMLNRDFNISSDGLGDTFESCENYVVRNISARNNGNLVASVKLKANVVGGARNGSFLSSPSNLSDISYKVSNSGRLNNTGGCIGGLGPTNYTSFLVVDHEYDVCDQLSFSAYGETNNSVVANFEILIPEDVDIGFSEVILTFTAEEY